MEYIRATTLPEALAFLAERPAKVVAGGTDVFPALQNQPLTEPVLDTSALTMLRQITHDDEGWHIGSGVTWTDILTAELPSAFNALKQAAREVGSIQIQNRATVAGNLCNASPAADGVPPLLVLDAEIELQSSRITRRLPLQDFIRGNRKTERAPDELVTGIHIPSASTSGTTAFQKLGARKYLVISIAMVAARLAFDNQDRVTAAAIAIGSCSPVAQRLRRIEQSLIGVTRSNIKSADIVLDTTGFDGLSPIDDVRAPATYRRESVRELTIRALAEAAT